MTFYNRIESVRGIAIDLTNGRKWRGASDKAAVFDALDAARREYMRLSDENAKLREQMERLVTLLRADCDIEASWDGLRKFWSIGLTEDGCLMRDRACKVEAENAKLRELIRELFRDFANADYELKSRCGRTFMAVTRYLPRLQELEVEP